LGPNEDQYIVAANQISIYSSQNIKNDMVNNYSRLNTDKLAKMSLFSKWIMVSQPIYTYLEFWLAALNSFT